MSPRPDRLLLASVALTIAFATTSVVFQLADSASASTHGHQARPSTTTAARTAVTDVRPTLPADSWFGRYMTTVVGR